MSFAPTMPQSVTGMPATGPEAPLAPPPQIPTVMPAVHPGNMPGGLPLPPAQQPPSMQQPGGNGPAFIVEQQPNGTGLLRATNPDGSIGPVIKIIQLPKIPGAAKPGQPPNPAVNMQSQ